MEYHPLSDKVLTVGRFSAGRLESNSFRFSSLTLAKICSFFSASMTPFNKVRISNSFSFFEGSE